MLRNRRRTKPPTLRPTGCQVTFSRRRSHGRRILRRLSSSSAADVAAAPGDARRFLAPKDQLQPELKEFDYTKPGDPLPKPMPVLFRIGEAGHDWKELKSDLFPNPFTESYHVDVQWSADGSEFYFDYNQRGHQLYRILAVNAQTGDVRVVVEETSADLHRLPGKDLAALAARRPANCSG